MQKSTSSSRKEASSAFALLAGAVFVEAVGVGVLFPLLAKIQSAHHLRTYGLGLMSGATFLASLVSQVAVARLLDGRLGRPVLLCGLALAALSPAWFSVAGSLWSLTAARAVGGASYGIVMPAALRAGTAGVPEDKRGLRLGILSSAQMAGIVAGPLVGVILYSVGGIALPFQVVAAVGAAVFLAVLTSRSAAVTTGIPHENRRGEDPARPMVASPAVVAVLILAAAAQLPNGFYDALWSRLLTDRGASTLLIGLSLAMFGLPFVVLAPFGGRLAGRSPIVWATGGLVVSAGFMASYGVIDSPAIIVVLGMFEACAWAVAVPASYAATARAIPDKWAATGQGWSSGAGTTAAGLAAIASAPSYQAFGPGPVFAGGAALSAAGALVAAAVWRRYSAADGRSAAEPVPVSTVPSPGTPLPASRQ